MPFSALPGCKDCRLAHPAINSSPPPHPPYAPGSRCQIRRFFLPLKEHHLARLAVIALPLFLLYFHFADRHPPARQPDQPGSARVMHRSPDRSVSSCPAPPWHHAKTPKLSRKLPALITQVCGMFVGWDDRFARWRSQTNTMIHHAPRRPWPPPEMPADMPPQIHQHHRLLCLPARYSASSGNAGPLPWGGKPNSAALAAPPPLWGGLNKSLPHHAPLACSAHRQSDRSGSGSLHHPVSPSAHEAGSRSMPPHCRPRRQALIYCNPGVYHSELRQDRGGALPMPAGVAADRPAAPGRHPVGCGAYFIARW